MLSNTDLPRFLRKFQQTPGGCWLWEDRLNPDGYGEFSIGDRANQVKIRAHKLSYLHFVGAISDGQFVCHSCDTPSCVNPAHLLLGSHQDNMDDMKQKGRSPKSKGSRKLTDDQVRELRASDQSLNYFVKKWGLSKSTLSMARNRKTFPELL